MVVLGFVSWEALLKDNCPVCVESFVPVPLVQGVSVIPYPACSRPLLLPKQMDISLVKLVYLPLGAAGLYAAKSCKPQAPLYLKHT